MDLELRNKVALVTGGSRGIGRAVALGLAAEGVKVAIAARAAAVLESAASEIRSKAGGEVLPLAADLSRLEEVERVARATHERFGRIDILVNNAGAIRAGDFPSSRRPTRRGSRTGTSSCWATCGWRGRCSRSCRPGTTGR